MDSRWLPAVGQRPRARPVSLWAGGQAPQRRVRVLQLPARGTGLHGIGSAVTEPSGREGELRAVGPDCGSAVGEA